MQTLITRTPRRLALAAVVASLSAPVVANNTLEEIVVTAQHREESLTDVPIAITALGAEELRTSGIDDLNGVSMRTPGFSMGSFTPSQPQLYIRGIGSNDDGAAGDQSVVVFLDGVYLARTAGQAFDLFDLERIEVLRGPQGTLYGKNAAGGAINVVSQKPTEEFSGAIELSAGDLGYKSTRAKVSGALAENVAGKIAVSYKERDGYVESLAEDANFDGLNGYESAAVRGQLLFTPSSELELLLTADYAEDDRNGPGRNLGSTYGVEQAVRLDPNNPSPGFYQNLIDSEPRSQIETWGLSLKADWEVGEGTFTSITAYRETDADAVDVAVSAAFGYQTAFAGLGFEGVAILDNPVLENSEQFTQEFRYALNFSDDLFLQAGFFYLNEQVERFESSVVVCSYACSSPVKYALPVGSTTQANQTDSFGLFAQGIWSVNDRTDVTFGARYTYEEKDATNVGAPNGLNVVAPYDVAMSENWSALTPKLAVNYAISDDISSYASVTTGFKSGGYQGMAPNGVAASTAFDEENVTNYEVGVKGTIADSLRFSAAAFRSDYSDLQVLRVVGVNQVTDNAGEAEIQGLELEGQWLVSDNFQLMATYAYLGTEYTELEGDLAASEGNSLRNAPKNAYSLSAIFDYPVASGNLNARADYISKDEAFQDIENRAVAAMPEYEVLNLRVAYTPASEEWEVAAWMKNALDEEYLAHNSVIAPLAELALPAAPRTWGVTFNYRFGN